MKVKPIRAKDLKVELELCKRLIVSMYDECMPDNQDVRDIVEIYRKQIESVDRLKQTSKELNERDFRLLKRGGYIQ